MSFQADLFQNVWKFDILLVCTTYSTFMKGRLIHSHVDETCEFQNLKIKSQSASKEIEGYRKKNALMPACKKARTS
jgi:hypothetical protein